MKPRPDQVISMNIEANPALAVRGNQRAVDQLGQARRPADDRGQPPMRGGPRRPAGRLDASGANRDRGFHQQGERPAAPQLQYVCCVCYEGCNISLACGHHLCMDCLERWTRIATEARIPLRCPYCRAVDPLPPGPEAQPLIQPPPQPQNEAALEDDAIEGVELYVPAPGQPQRSGIIGNFDGRDLNVLTFRDYEFPSFVHKPVLVWFLFLPVWVRWMTTVSQISIHQLPTTVVTELVTFLAHRELTEATFRLLVAKCRELSRRLRIDAFTELQVITYAPVYAWQVALGVAENVRAIRLGHSSEIQCPEMVVGVVQQWGFFDGALRILLVVLTWMLLIILAMLPIKYVFRI